MQYYYLIAICLGQSVAEGLYAEGGQIDSKKKKFLISNGFHRRAVAVKLMHCG
jgi:hypothetical protein